jgi:prepilin-type N-terminal cleavage/methylation domain-containing protein
VTDTRRESVQSTAPSCPPCGRARAARHGGFTLVELLIVVAIVALLISMLLPALRHARTGARIVRAHAELRQVDIALQMYADTNANRLPPTRFSCSLRVDYELPLELGAQRLLPGQRDLVHSQIGSGFIERVVLPDVFDAGTTYKYRAPGTAVMNETQVEPYMSRLWVPDAFPDVGAVKGRYYSDNPSDPEPYLSPVRYAIWSVGPDKNSPKFRTPGTPVGRGPIPAFFWCKRSSDSGFIVHYQARDGKLYQSP